MEGGLCRYTRIVHIAPKVAWRKPNGNEEAPVSLAVERKRQAYLKTRNIPVTYSL
jgi:hypothetical protein